MNLAVVKNSIIHLHPQERAELMDFTGGDLFYLSNTWKEEIQDRERKLESGISIGKPAKEVLGKYVKS